MNDKDDKEKALRTARVMLDIGHPLKLILESQFIPPEYREYVQTELERNANFILSPAAVITADATRRDWLGGLDRSQWHYWPALREFLIAKKNWDQTSICALDDASDKILKQLAPPWQDEFDIRGLVLGYVQSGKTANFTALIAKAADSGYRLVIVLSGIDNGLRKQTNARLKRELVGYAEDLPNAIRMPPVGHRWHEFTMDNLDGDFNPGQVTHAALQGTQPVLMVVKKNGTVLRRLLAWLDAAPGDVRKSLPLLVIDDEADQASIDTHGTYQRVDEETDSDGDYEQPSVINGLIRDLLRQFSRRSYVAYTATPFANILIPHDVVDPTVGNDLYPKDFIVDLPKPRSYFGAEEIFGRPDPESGEMTGGLDVIRIVPDTDLAILDEGGKPESLVLALRDFVLAGAAKAHRGRGHEPATMLIHTSHRIAAHDRLYQITREVFTELRDSWRYQRKHGIREGLKERWDTEFRPLVRYHALSLDVPFETIESYVGPFLEAVQVQKLNSSTGEVLDYDRDPTLKAIAIGGNKLSRGLTLEGLMVSYFVRSSAMYDTLMQMGRWFGFREGYEDLTRIYTTPDLASWFGDLAMVEFRLREDIRIYEDHGLTPKEVGMRIWQHPTMQVTAPLKRRFARSTTISQSYSFHLEQTVRFPLRRLADLARQEDSNLVAVKSFVKKLGRHDPKLTDDGGPVWAGVSPRCVIEFLNSFRIDDQARSMSIPLLTAYIAKQNAVDELTEWTVAVRGRGKADGDLGTADWSLPTGPVAQISRSRLKEVDSVGVIVDPADEAVGLDTERRGKEARAARPSKQGLLLLYPISRFSGQGLTPGGARAPLYDSPTDRNARDLIGLAISFPRSKQPQTVQAYLEGTLKWSPVE